MKIFKSKYGWSTTAHSNTQSGEKIRNFVDCQFKKGEEPIGEEIEGELIFRGADGVERDCFFSSYLKQGEPVAKLVLIHKKPEKKVQTTLSGDMRTADGHLDPNYSVTITEEELPFY